MLFLANVSALVGAVISGFIFKKHFVSSKQKLSYLCIMTLLMAATSILPLYTSSLPWLILVVSARQFLGQMVELPCQGLYVHTLGPKKSQPLIMLFHCTVAVGFLLGPLIIGPFFPTSMGKNEGVCSGGLSSDSVQLNHDVQNVIESIKTPYWFMFYGHCICAVGYLLLTRISVPMPVFANSTITKNKAEKTGPPLIGLWPLIIFYMASCGSERLFQTMEFTFALCGPLALSSQQAVITDDAYNGGFFVGRLASVLAVKLMKPTLMLKTSLVTCFLSTALISWQGDQSAFLLYTGASLFGFAVSWQYGSAFSWAAQFMDVVGPRASIFTTGCSLSFFAPIIGAYLFHRWSPMSIWHFNGTIVILQFFAFWKLRYIFDNQRASTYSYHELNQMEEVNLSSEEEE